MVHCNPAPPHPPSDVIPLAVCPEPFLLIVALTIVGGVILSMVGTYFATADSGPDDAGGGDDRPTADFQTMREKMKK